MFTITSKPRLLIFTVCLFFNFITASLTTNLPSLLPDAIETLYQNKQLNLHTINQSSSVSLDTVINETLVSSQEASKARKPAWIYKILDKSKVNSSIREFISFHINRGLPLPENLALVLQPVSLHNLFNLKESAFFNETFAESTGVPSHEAFKDENPVSSHESLDDENPLSLHQTFDMRKPVILDPTFDMRKPVVLDPTFDMRKPVVLDPTHDMRKPVVLDPTHDMEVPEINKFHKTLEAVKNENLNHSTAFIKSPSELPKLNSSFSKTCGRLRKVTSKQLTLSRKKLRNFRWPWMISLQHIEEKLIKHKCGAVLLSQSWVVTAAHCVFDHRKILTCEAAGKSRTFCYQEHRKLPVDLILQFENFNSEQSNNMFQFIKHSVLEIIIHPKFVPDTYENDLALLKLEKPVKKDIVPVCFLSDVEDLTGQIAIVTGWRKSHQKGELSDFLNEGFVPIISNQQCEDLYFQANYLMSIPDIFICAGLSSKSLDVCEELLVAFRKGNGNS